MSTPHVPKDGGSALSRRSLLGAVALTGAATVTGTVLGSRPAGAHGTLVSHSEIADQATYEFDRGNSRPGSGGLTGGRTLQYDATFYGRLETWLNYWYAHTPATWLKPMELYISHIHREYPSTSYHQYGRAMDLIRVYMTTYVDTPVGRQYYRELFFNARGHEINQSSPQWKWYWAGVASLSYHFRHTIHFHDPSDPHVDHVHADNAVSGSGNSTFTTGSSTQVSFVQAALRYIWGYNTGIDGQFGPQTTSHVNGALARIGRSGSLTTQSNWLAFCEATTRFGTGRQTY